MIIQTINDEATTKKSRTIEIIKNEVFTHIDLHTYKFVDASGNPDVRTRNAISSDHAEEADGMIIGRNVEFWEAKLRRMIHGMLESVDVVYANDELNITASKYVYNLSLPESFDDNLLEPMASYMHRFIAFGALYDWYTMIGNTQMAANYKAQLKEAEDAIKSMSRGGSIAARPMQPFGPSYKFR